MRHVRDVVRLKSAGVAVREIARRVGAAIITKCVRATIEGDLTLRCEIASKHDPAGKERMSSSVKKPVYDGAKIVADRRLPAKSASSLPSMRLHQWLILERSWGKSWAKNSSPVKYWSEADQKTIRWIVFPPNGS